MSADVATLSLRVDSSQVTAAVPALAKLQAAAVATGTAHASMSTQAMAAQHSIRSMIEQVALGVPPTMILGQQMSHLAFAASGPGGISGAFKEAGASLARLISPTTAVIGGVVAAAGAAYLANSAWEKYALALDDTAKATGLTTSALRGLENAASAKGIDDFSKSAEKFAGNIYDAQAGMGNLASLLRANGSSATTLANTLARVADLVRNARDDQQRLQILQQAGLPATMAYVRLMMQGGDAVRQAVLGHKDLNSAEQKLIDNAREFDEAWNRTWTNFKSGAFDAVTSVKSGLTELGTLSARVRAYFNPTDANARVGVGFGSLSTIQNAALQSGLENRARQMRGEQTTIDPNVIRKQLADEQPWVGVLGSTPVKKSDEKNDGDHSRKAA
jgi:hypothetical protein